jgi:hypothetical protein
MPVPGNKHIRERKIQKDRLKAVFVGPKSVLPILTGAFLFLSLTTGLAQSQSFESDPRWESGLANITRSLALGDVDNDGILDLICGNFSQTNTLYLGVTGLFSTVPVWSSQFTNLTLSVALGDVDGDGDLDLVCGNMGANTLYRNNPGFNMLRLEWESGLAYTTSSVVLGDVDGDGDLDLVCGNIDNVNTVYRNTGHTFETLPAWSSSAANATWDVALGDVDGDNDLDLVCGNAQQANTLYLNIADSLSTVPAWVSDSTSFTTSVFLGDVDGDGDFDLVCGNYDEPNTAYFNQAGIFETAPTWMSAASESTLAVALGDVDGDNDLDLVCGNEGQPNTLHLNSGGIFEVSPGWSSSNTSNTTGIALADADGDGDLDMICANSNQTNTVYVNISGHFETTESWISSPANGTLATALGDVDNDGDLDLVCGNSGYNTCYRNEGGVLGAIPAWSSARLNLTADVALGDVDGDGDLDLVCGNAAPPGQANTLYLNLGDTFATSPAWSSLAAHVTTGVVLVDVNNDNRLDLVCANSGSANSVYLNTGGVFDTVSDWAPISNFFSTDVASGDLDGDGDSDIAFSNSGWSNTVYLNQYNIGLTFTIYQAWRSDPLSASSCVALGDVEGDGDLDLAFGNVEQANVVYLNADGVIQTNPEWSSGPTNRTGGVALGDVDGDGDLDLVFANLSQQNTIYLNEAATTGATTLFESSPVWSSAAARETEDVVLGDIDGDGDLDLVFGNELQPNTAYMGKKNPAYLWDPANPSNHLPNNGAYITSISADTMSAANRVKIRFECVDVEADPVWLLPQFRFQGDAVWRTMDMGAAEGLIGPFVSSIGGSEDSLEWDISLIPFDDRDVTVRLSAVERPARLSYIQKIPSFEKLVGRVEPTRPQITTPAGPLVFSTVTVGDTVWLDVPVSNIGNVDLNIDGILLPSTELRVEAATPLSISPGVVDTFRVYLEPVGIVSFNNKIDIVSDDPMRPVASILISADIRALEVTSTLLSDSEVIPLGEAATVIVEPYPFVDVEKGYLFHRAVGQVQFDSIPLSPIGTEFVAVIPGAAVEETGLEYYIQVENTPVVVTDPPNAPHDSLFFRAVQPPAVCLSTPRPTFNDDYYEALRIKVEVTLPQGSVFQSGTLFFRPGGTAFYDSTVFSLDGALPSAFIPDSAVGSKGVEYWVRVKTPTSTLTHPRLFPRLHPLSIPVTVEDLLEPGSHAGGAYRLLSIPLGMRGGILGSIADELGGTDDTQWRLFGYETANSRYVELPDESLSGFERGRAYWLITRERHRIGTGPDRGDTAPTDQPFEILLQPGYNLIGSPFCFSVSWDSLLVDTLSVTDPLAGTLVEPPVKWVAGHGYDYDVTTLEPFDGYWIKNLAPSPVTLVIPPVEQSTAVNGLISESVTGSDAVTAEAWWLQISASCGVVVDQSARLGVRPGAETEWDANDRSMPPPVPQNALAVYFPHSSWSLNPGKYARDIHDFAKSETVSEGDMWRFDIAKSFSVESAGDEVVLEFTGTANIPDEKSVYLLDCRLDRTINLRERDSYRFYLGKTDFVADEESARFVVLAGDDEYISLQREKLIKIPRETTLYQNYPNPFNPRTIIRYEVANPGHVSVNIYDVKGTLVKILEERDRTPGRYEIGWNGENEHGVSVASGVYFYRLVTGDYEATRKMVLLK